MEVREGAVCTLDALRVGEEGALGEIGRDHPLRERLIDLGWTAGTRVRCVRVSPLGDPIAYRVRGGVIALRRADGQGIAVVLDGASVKGDGGNGKKP